MCGIIGAAGILPKKEKFEYARDVLAHRGPDDAGLYYEPKENIALGHRRLSIIDLSSAGHQPFFSNDGRFAVIFNGEIYNYPEIKKELKKFYDFKTRTDTEVLLASYIKWGEKCLDKFNGMFAFAIWDKLEQKLFCARDRLGIKPFFYIFDSGKFLFASEIKALLALGIKRKANENIIFDYLRYGFYDHTDETFFDGIRKLHQGHYLFWQKGKLKIKKYWDLIDSRKDFSGFPKKAIEANFKSLLEDSIKLRFRSDVPVGLNLSSGLDSNSLLYFSHKVTGRDLHAFSMCSPYKEYNECALIGETLNKRQRKFWHRSMLLLKEVFPLAEKMNNIQDQPYGGVPVIAYDKLIEEAQKSKIIVLLEGQGSDEILAGYKYYLSENIKKGVSLFNYSKDMTKETDTEILNKDFINSKRHHKLLFSAPFDSGLLNAQYRDIMCAKLPRVLRFNDHITMAYGRELRLPFLDYRIVEFCFWLPEEYKINPIHQKVLLRETMKEYLPRVIRNKPKKFFGAIQTLWFRKYFKNEIFSLINSHSFRKRGYWDYKRLSQKTKDFYEGIGDNSFFLWQCLNLEMWFNKYIDK